VADGGAIKDTVPSEAVETFQVMNDILPEATGTAERLLGRFEARFASPFVEAINVYSCLSVRGSSGETEKTNRARFICLTRSVPLATVCAPAETFRGPRGLREVVVNDLERLYRLRREGGCLPNLFGGHGD
jgi:hypothetical protein